MPAVPTPCRAVPAPLGRAGHRGQLRNGAGTAGPQPHPLQPVPREEVKGPEGGEENKGEKEKRKRERGIR